MPIVLRASGRIDEGEDEVKQDRTRSLECKRIRVLIPITETVDFEATGRRFNNLKKIINSQAFDKGGSVELKGEIGSGTPNDILGQPKWSFC
jgi:hypothetical protein